MANRSETSQKKAWYRRAWVWIVAAVIVIAAIGAAVGGGDDSPSATDSKAKNSASTPASKAGAASKSSSPTVAAKPKGKPKGTVTTSQKNALASAENYLGTMPFSQKGLVKQLSSEIDGFSKEDAEWAASHVKADWNEQAAKAAKNYQDTIPQSGPALKKQLEFDGFTPEQAAHGVSSAGL